jgi:hypothetical protein
LVNIAAVPTVIARTLVVAAVLFGAVGCGFDTSTTFNADGSVTVGLKFLFPKSLMDGANGATVTGMSPSDIASANAKLQSKYPGGKITVVTEGDEKGALVTIPFKTEKDAFTFLTAPTQLSPSGATSGTGIGINLSNTGGLFASATHTTSGQTDTYTFKTAPVPQPSPSPGQQQIISGDEISSVFVITFALTVPHEITSAPGALFTLDRKTAIWKLSWTQAETLTATTGPDTGLVAAVTPAPNSRLLIAVGFIAIAVGFVLGMLMPWRSLRRVAPEVAVSMSVSSQPPLVETPAEWPGPPPDVPPPGTPPPV